VLVVDPRLPEEWGALELRLGFRGFPFRLRIDREGVSLDAGPELALHHHDRHWEVVLT
jgi:trehalose/maltose hydrolase-like predicted phosphorylase